MQVKNFVRGRALRTVRGRVWPLVSALVRDAYLQRREYLVNGGEVHEFDEF